MAGPTLSPLERERLAAAAKLAASGVRVRWSAIGSRLTYGPKGTEHLVLTAPNRRVFDALCRQAEREFQRLGGTNVNECSSAA